MCFKSNPSAPVSETNNTAIISPYLLSGSLNDVCVITLSSGLTSPDIIANLCFGIFISVSLSVGIH